METVAADIEEYEALTTGCALVDRSERGKLALTGSDAAEFLNGQVTNNIVSLTPGEGCYAAFLTHKGKMLGDLRVLATEDELLLDTERVALQALFDMIRRFSVGHAVELHKRTVQRGLLSLIGPRSAQALGGTVPGSAEHANVWGSIADEPVLLITTDVGFDVLVDSDATERVHAALVTAGAVPAGESGAETVRVESGRPRYGLDLDETTIPQEARLNGRAVSFTKGCYVGQETVARLFYRGKPNRRLCGLLGSGPLAPGMQITYEDRTAGRVTSAAESPRFGAIALALVRREAPVGALVSLGPLVGAELVELPFA